MGEKLSQFCFLLQDKFKRGSENRKKILNFLLLLFLLAVLPLTVSLVRKPQEYSKKAQALQTQGSLKIFAPSNAIIGMPVNLSVVAFEGNGDVNSNLQGKIQISFKGKNAPSPFSYAFKESDQGKRTFKDKFSCPTSGFYIIYVEDKAGILEKGGIPIKCSKTEEEYKIYWGDIHAHSTLSDGKQTPDFIYNWAKNVANLNFFALSDHNWALNNDKIATLKQKAKQYHKPGKFVTFFGFEFAPGLRRGAYGRPNHKNTYFLNVDENTEGLKPLFRPEGVEDPNAFWNLLEGRTAITIPHHTGLPYDTYFGTNWGYHHEKMQRLVEIFSHWGNSERYDAPYPLPQRQKGNFVIDALKRGYRLGFIGSSDDHSGHPGTNYKSGHHNVIGLAAVYSKSLTRNGLWDGLWNRRTYATTHAERIIIEFEINGHKMGEEFEANAPPEIKFSVAGTSPLKKVVVVKYDKTGGYRPFKTITNLGGETHQETITDNEFVEDSFYYLRVFQENGALAWSSPIWIKEKGVSPQKKAQQG